jgi:hypothetical protein
MQEVVTQGKKDNQFWYPAGVQRHRIGVIIDQYDEYTELQDLDTGKYVIVLDKLLQPKIYDDK